jgi:hypothetical protein
MEVLQVINSTPGGLTSVFDTVLEKAMHLCQAAHGYLRIFDGEYLQPPVAYRGDPEFVEFMSRRQVRRASPMSLSGRILAGEPIVHITDLTENDLHRQGHGGLQALVEKGGARTALAVARKDETPLGAIILIAVSLAV